MDRIWRKLYVESTKSVLRSKDVQIKARTMLKEEVVMKKNKRQSDRCRNAAMAENVVRKEFQDLSDNLKRAENKRKEWKKRCRDQESKLKMLAAEVKHGKEELEMEKKEGARRELFAKIQSHLDAWSLYYEGEEGKL